MFHLLTMLLTLQLLKFSQHFDAVLFLRAVSYDAVDENLYHNIRNDKVLYQRE